VSLGDVNKDGYDDVLLQAYNASSGAGNAYVLFGNDQLATAASNAGLASLASGSIGTIAYKQGGSPGTIAILSELGSAGALTGQGNYGAGDINADGYNDILLGSGALAKAYLTKGHAYLESISNLQLSRLTSDNGFMLDGLATTLLRPNLSTIVAHVREGTLDFVLLKPIDSQFWLSTRTLSPWGLPEMGVGLGLSLWAAWQSGARPGAPTPPSEAKAA
jgi:hypothetical protein